VGRRGRPRAGAAAYRVAWCTVAALAGAVGFAGGCVFLGGFAAACLAGVGALLGATAVPWRPRPPTDPARSPAGGAVLGAVLPLATIGLLAELGLPALALCGLLAAGWWPLRRRPAAPRAARRAPAVPPPPAPETLPPDPLPTAAALPGLSTADLCRVWRATYTRLERCTWSGEREHLAALRRACLDELERRDPRAFARWIATARAAGDPARAFLREQRQP
jgi:hypothetical protein